jgi:hypothetical protein
MLKIAMMRPKTHANTRAHTKTHTATQTQECLCLTPLARIPAIFTPLAPMHPSPLAPSYLIVSHCVCNQHLLFPLKMAYRPTVDGGAGAEPLHTGFNARVFARSAKKRTKMENSLLGDKYEPVKRIGHGSYGSVYLAKQQQGGSGYVVLKRVFVVEEGAKEHREAVNEVKLLARLRHKNIVAYRDSFVHDNHLCIVMAYCAGGDLQAQVKCAREAGVLFTREQVEDWMAQLIDALRYLHEDKKILHRDLKSQNVFLVPERVRVQHKCHAVAPASGCRGLGHPCTVASGASCPDVWALHEGDLVLVTHRVRGGWAHCHSSALPASCVAAEGKGKAGMARIPPPTSVRKGYIAGHSQKSSV